MKPKIRTRHQDRLRLLVDVTAGSRSRSIGRWQGRGWYRHWACLFQPSNGNLAVLVVGSEA